VHCANKVEEVFELMKAPDLGETILLTDSPSATALVPLLAKVRGLVCRSGGMTSHLAIVSREFGLPAVMGADVDSPGELEGERIVVDAEGQISRA
jgi:phosphoenolpyruvate-protein kinase (PTS system EI component)